MTSCINRVVDDDDDCDDTLYDDGDGDDYLYDDLLMCILSCQ
jgi:hypothetical protein